MASLAGARNIVKHGGVSALFKLSLDRILGRLFDFRLVKVQLTSPSLLGERSLTMDPKFEIRELDSDIIQELMMDSENRLYPDFIKRALQKQDRCFAVFDKTSGALASFCWYSIKPTNALKGVFVFDPRVFYGFHSYTKPQYRGAGLSSVIAKVAMEKYVGEGYIGQVGMIDWSNFRSLHAVRKRQPEFIGRICRYRLGSKWFTHIWRNRDDIEFGLIEPEPAEQNAT